MKELLPIIKKKVKDLKPAKYNPRKITDWQFEKLGYSMEEFGDLSGVVMNIRTDRIIGGHQRIKHIDPNSEIVKKPHKDKTGTVALGYIVDANGTQWTYREVDWEEQKELVANIAANKHGGDFDFPKLKEIIAEIDVGDFDIEVTGFSEDELNGLFDYEKEIKEKEIDELETDNKCPKCGFDLKKQNKSK